ncbi:MAG: alpha/beta hydrolase [Candidatus Heimdallarchaeota archaeon]|nr:alpha/beta hydrolase [Candidatus Heimdallarchaeota archaeon]
MEFVEKTLSCYEFPEFETGPMEKLAKLPQFIVTWLLKKNIAMYRKSMGGISNDITTKRMIIEDFFIEGYSEKIRIRKYQPEGESPKPAFIFFHGGGWVGGSLWAVEQFVKGVCDQGGFVGFSVEYHLAPEYPFPEGLEDCYLTVKHIIDHAAEYNIKRDSISISGDSAGGNFAAIISNLTRSRKEFDITSQILIYPALRLPMRGKNKQENSPPSWMNKFTSSLIAMYTGRKVKVDDPTVSPMNEPNLENLPATMIAVGTEDTLYSESLEYAEKLSKAGNKVKFIAYKNANHAFIDFTGNCEQADDLVSETVKFINQQ